MGKVRIKLNSKGVRDLLRSTEMQNDLKRRAGRIAAAAGEGHRVEVGTTRKRARAVVITETFEAMRAEATDRSLSRSIDAGRG